MGKSTENRARLSTRWLGRKNAGFYHTIRIFPNRCRNSRSLNRHRPFKVRQFCVIGTDDAGRGEQIQDTPRQCSMALNSPGNGLWRDHRNPLHGRSSCQLLPQSFRDRHLHFALFFGHFDIVRAIGAATRMSARIHHPHPAGNGGWRAARCRAICNQSFGMSRPSYQLRHGWP
jgi:hypothetical protein